MKNFSRRQLLLFLILFLSIACAAVGIIVKSDLLLYIESVLLTLGLIIVLRATERGELQSISKNRKGTAPAEDRGCQVRRKS